jgi:hypothetical protein
MPGLTSHEKILRELRRAQGAVIYFHGRPLPEAGLVYTGILHGPGIGGTSARTRISELRRKGYNIQAVRIEIGNRQYSFYKLVS